jgi:L-fuculokinase
LQPVYSKKMKQKVTLIFDIGKTNKKYFLFDENLVQIKSAYKQIPEITDDDGFPCDDLGVIEEWMFSVYEEIRNDGRYSLMFINFSAYGATMVHLNENGKPCTPLYNYLKELPSETISLFKEKYGPTATWSQQTSSPFLGMLNAGLQLFWLKYHKPSLFKQIRCSIFLPQYFSYLFSSVLISEFTGIGSHTGMWDFKKNDFHFWIYAEGFTALLPPIHSNNKVFTIPGTVINCGAGVHDSSAALIPYIKKNKKPFILLSTGTWSICLNPFNDTPLQPEELEEDCLCYLQPDGKQVKASRFFMGNEFSKWVKVLNKHFDVPVEYHKNVKFNELFYTKAKSIKSPIFTHNIVYKDIPRIDNLSAEELGWFSSYEEAYHQLIKELLVIQVQKIGFIMRGVKISKIYVDGGFADNDVFIKMLAQLMPDFSIVPSEMPLGTSLGAAMQVIKENVKGEPVY